MRAMPMPSTELQVFRFSACDGLALLGVGLGVVDEAIGEEEGEQADGDVDEEDPAPVVVVGDPSAEDGADGGSGDDSDGVESEG